MTRQHIQNLEMNCTSRAIGEDMIEYTGNGPRFPTAHSRTETGKEGFNTKKCKLQALEVIIDTIAASKSSLTL